jgi:hypothetical protein
MRAHHLGPTAALLLALLLSAPCAFAQSATDKAAAEGLFDQGRAAMQRGDFGQACGLLERSQHIDPAVGTLLYLAECYERSGRTASAWATFREAADAADAAREPARARTGRERALRLEPVLARLTIELAPDNVHLQGLSVERRGQTAPTATWNVPVPVDPGEYPVTVSAPGYEPWSTTVTIPARAANISVTVPALKRAPDADKPSAAPGSEAALAAPPVANAEVVRSDPSSPPAAASEKPDGSTQKMAAYVLGGAGVVGIGIGSIFGLRAITKNNDAESNCPRGYQCDNADGVALSDDAKSAARVSNVAFAVGAAALIGGVVLYFTAPGASQAMAGPTMRARLTPSSVSLEGSF